MLYSWQKLSRKIVEAEYDDGNADIKEIRMRKAEVDELLAPVRYPNPPSLGTNRNIEQGY